MYLADTNIFLEILLEQEKKERCKQFLDTHVGDLLISDFSLHSIGVIVFRSGQEAVFTAFLKDVLPLVEIVTLSRAGYDELTTVRQQFRLDFDDAYQCQVVREQICTLVTLDSDFERVKHEIPVNFL